MKRRSAPSTIIALANFVALQTMSAEPDRLSASHSDSGLELSWPATVQQSDGSVARPYFELQRTLDFRRWQPIGERQRAATQAPGERLGVTVELDQQQGFYRLLRIPAGGIAKLGPSGEEGFGYGEALAPERQHIGQISPD